MIIANARRAAPLLALATALMISTAGEAVAGSVEVVTLASPDGYDGGETRGRIRVKESRRATRVKVKVRGLAPRARFLVRDEEADRTLGELTTNRRGRGRAKLRFRHEGKRSSTPIEAERLSVTEADTGTCVLRFGDPETEGEAGLDLYDGEDAFAAVSMLSMPGYGVESLTITLAEASDCYCARQHLYHAAKSEGDGLPFGADSAADLAGRGFEVRDAEGEVAFGGKLPALGPLDGPPTQAGEVRLGAEPYAFWLADGEGVLHEIAELETEDGSSGDGDIDIWIDPAELPPGEFGFALYGGTGPRIAAVALASVPSQEIEWLSVLLIVEGAEEETAYALTLGEDGGAPLPFELAEVKDLVGRRFEIRDANGKAVVAANLPELVDLSGSPAPEPPKPTGEVAPGVSPFSLHVADAADVLTYAGELAKLP